MVSAEDVRRITFDKAMRGYRCEDVDDYLKQVAESIAQLSAENDDLQKKIQVLAQRIEDYRAEENTLHTTLINAQRLGENVIKEAKQKAAEVIRSANIQAEDREQRARDEVELSKQELSTMKKEVSEFKRTMMELYRQHIEMLSSIPEYENGQAVQAVQEEPEPQLAPEPQPEAADEPAAEVLEAPQAPAPLEEDFFETAEPDTAASGVEKIDTVEFAMAPREETDERPAARSGRQNFAPGAGLYDAPEDQPAPRSRNTSRARGTSARKSRQAQQEPTEELPSAFDSFSGIDFNS